MQGFEKTEVLGNLGKDPDMFTTDGGKKISKFSVAVNTVYFAASGEKKEKTNWYNVVCFDSQAEFCYQYLKKGDGVFIEGSMQFRKYLAKDQTEKSVTELVAKKVYSMGGRNPRPEQNDGGEYDYNQDPLADFDRPAKASAHKSEQGDLLGSTAITEDNPITDDDIPF